MADQTQQEQLSFGDVQKSITQLVNDNIAQNDTVAAGIKEVERLIEDFSSKANGDHPPSQADFQSVLDQLATLHENVQQNTTSIKNAAADIQAADPAPATPEA